MNRTLFILCLLLAAWIGRHLAAGPDHATADHTRGTARINVTVVANVVPFSEWADPSPILFEAQWTNSDGNGNQRQTLSKQVVLYTNTDTLIAAHPALNNGILTQGPHTLNTAYKLTGAVASPDHSFKPAPAFFSAHNVYQVIHLAGTGAYALTLEVQMSSPPSAAPDEGVYTCGVTLTAGW